MRALLTLLTDFGIRDSYVAQMKGRILALAPDLRVVDLTHDIEPQDVRGASFVLAHAVGAFPPETVHLAVVDPGVGGPRRAVAIEAANGRFVGPDNGLLARAAQEPRRAVEIDAALAVSGVGTSATFHGRDVFAPTAALLATGTPLVELGRAVDDLVHLPPAWRHRAGELEAEIVRVDHFGNAITDLPVDALRALGSDLVFHCGELQVHGLAQTYVDVPRHAPLAYVGSAGTLEFALRDGDFADRVAITVGERVRVRKGG